MKSDYTPLCTHCVPTVSPPWDISRKSKLVSELELVLVSESG